jgi:hypothetical protein
MSIAAKLYNQILLNRISRHVDPACGKTKQAFAQDEVVHSRYTFFKECLKVSKTSDT